MGAFASGGKRSSDNGEISDKELELKNGPLNLTSESESLSKLDEK
jgi:hypothetical protein